MPLILGTNSIKDTGYDVANSCRFNNASDDSLTRSLGASETSLKKGTLSFWIKRAEAVGTAMWIYSNEVDNDNNRAYIEIDANDNLRVLNSQGGSDPVYFITDAEYRDFSAWSHFVIAIDTTQGTESNRVKIYNNGVQITSFSQATYPSVNTDLKLFEGGQTNKNHIGNIHGQSAKLSAYLSEFVYIDGLQLDASSFGEFDSDSPNIWKPIDVSGLTFGNNGFYLDFQDSSALGNDVSGNNNDFTVNNLTSVDQSTDTCTNNFATMSTPTWYDGTITNGGLTVSTNQSNYRYQTSTIGFSKGKWYWEIKFVSYGNYSLMGITDSPAPINEGSNWILGSGAYDYSVVYNNAGGNGHKYHNAGTSPSNTPGAYMNGFSAGDIIMFALDCDNNTLKIGAGGSWANGSGNTNQTFSNTTAISITAPASTNTGFYFPAVGDYGGSTSVFDFNFGSPPYSITSGNADGNGYGNFEYSVPSGYYSINTKNLAEFG